MLTTRKSSDSLSYKFFNPIIVSCVQAFRDKELCEGGSFAKADTLNLLVCVSILCMLALALTIHKNDTKVIKEINGESRHLLYVFITVFK